MDKHWHDVRKVAELPTFGVDDRLRFGDTGSRFNGQTGRVVILRDIIDGTQGYCVQTDGGSQVWCNARSLVPDSDDAPETYREPETVRETSYQGEQW